MAITTGVLGSTTTEITERLAALNTEGSYASSEEDCDALWELITSKKGDSAKHQGDALLTLTRAELALSDTRKAELEEFLLKALTTGSIAFDIRSGAIRAVGLGGESSHFALPALYKLFETNPLNLAGLAARAIAQIAATSESLPPQFQFCWHGGLDGRIGVLGKLLDADSRAVNIHAAVAIKNNPQGLWPLAERLDYIADSVRDIDSALFTEAAKATRKAEAE